MTGANGTGKTTLAQAFAQLHDIPFVRTSGSAVFALLGLDPSKEYPIEQRLGIQEAMLSAFEAQYAEAGKRTQLWISDRTPIDLASYMLADVQRETVAHRPQLGAMINDYVGRCIEATNRWFSVVVLVQPGIPVAVQRDGKAMSCPSFMLHLDRLQQGLLKDEKIQVKNFYIPRQYISMQDRLDALRSAVGKALATHQDLMARMCPTLH